MRLYIGSVYLDFLHKIDHKLCTTHQGRLLPMRYDLHQQQSVSIVMLGGSKALHPVRYHCTDSETVVGKDQRLVHTREAVQPTVNVGT